MKDKKVPSTSRLEVSGIHIEVVRKAIKNLHLSVLPPDGRVRVSAPQHISDDRVRAAVSTRLSWIKKQQSEFASQPRQGEREMVTGETHYLWGKRYRLEVIEHSGKHEVRHKNGNKLQLFVRPGTTVDNRQKVMSEWYRQQLKDRIPTQLAKWQKKIGVQVDAWGVKKMKTKWGSCHIGARRIWLNLDLVCKPPECLEYILVHELVHLLERNHNNRFKALMDEFMPDWQMRRKLLNRAPLANERWVY
jgi:predicted metal-dependent hydrolase